MQFPQSLFTGKERDAESGNDYFGARYYASTMGRFMSPDPVWINPKRMVDPQRLNLYAYARNNPLRFIDPNGEDIVMGKCSGGTAQSCFSQLQKTVPKADRDHLHLVLGDGKNGFKKGQFGVTADKDYRSDSKNFQRLQNLANDHSATAQIDKLGRNDPLTIKTNTSWPSTQLSNVTAPWDHYADGFTLPEYRGKQFSGIPFSAGPYTDVIVSADMSDEDVIITMAHELVHVELMDFGRKLPQGQDGQPEFEKVRKAAEAEAERNAKE